MALKDNYFTISEAAKECGVTRQSVSRWISEGEISAEKVGRLMLIEKSEVYRYQRDRRLIAEGENFLKNLIAYVRKSRGYPEGDDIDLLRFDSKNGIFFLSNRKQDGNCEIIRITMGIPVEITQGEDDPSITMGMKVPITKIDTIACNESDMKDIRDKELMRLNKKVERK